MVSVRTASALVAIVIAWRLGYRDADLISAWTCIFLFLWLIAGLFIGGLVIPPGVERDQGKPIGEALSFHLTDKPDGDKKSVR
jgi:hypothetical protein